MSQEIIITFKIKGEKTIAPVRVNASEVTKDQLWIWFNLAIQELKPK